ncbi:hypothetical protein AB0M48_32340 [Lentzea sp. NPDC051208]|uniref:hypothetical protein n=1 Tax=Lentzea sp. NPDC051208 TaxID=3154642 RepID=UPI0034145E48
MIRDDGRMVKPFFLANATASRNRLTHMSGLWAALWHFSGTAGEAHCAMCLPPEKPDERCGVFSCWRSSQNSNWKL